MDKINKERMLDEIESIFDRHFDKPNQDQLSKLEVKLKEIVESKGSINWLIPTGKGQIPVWLAYMVVAEAVYGSPGALKINSKAENEPIKNRIEEALQFIKSLEKPLYKSYRGGKTAFYYCVSLDSMLLAEILIDDGLDVALEKTPVHTLVQEVAGPYRVYTDEGMEDDYNSSQPMKLLERVLSMGCSPDQGFPNSTHYPYPLTMACEFSAPYVADLLIKYGADVNIKDKYGATPILYAIDDVLSSTGGHHVRTKAAELTELLLKNGASLDVRTTQNRTFVSMVKGACHSELQKEIFGIVEKYRGKDALKPPKNNKKKDRYENLLTQEQMAVKDIPMFTKMDEVAWVLSCFKENGVEKFTPGHVVVAYNSLKIDRYGEGILAKCSRTEAVKNLNKIIKRKVMSLNVNEDEYEFV